MILFIIKSRCVAYTLYCDIANFQQSRIYDLSCLLVFVESPFYLEMLNFDSFFLKDLRGDCDIDNFQQSRVYDFSFLVFVEIPFYLEMLNFGSFSLRIWVGWGSRK